MSECPLGALPLFPEVLVERLEDSFVHLHRDPNPRPPKLAGGKLDLPDEPRALHAGGLRRVDVRLRAELAVAIPEGQPRVVPLLRDPDRGAAIADRALDLEEVREVGADGQP